MINQLTLRNFKIHKNLNLPLSKLNLFTGLNGMGKSSVLQAFLLLRQSYLKNNALKSGLILNGDLTKIGTAPDAYCEDADGDIEIKINFEQNQLYSWLFRGNADDDFLELIEKSIDNEQISSISLFNNNFQYISAERIAPTQTHEKNTLVVKQEQQISEKHGRAEYTVHFLEQNKLKRVSHQLLHKNTENDDLLEQVNAWLGEISPDINIIIQTNALNKNEIILGFKYKSEYGFTKDFKPENVGFGISYVLPIIVAILSSEPNSILFIENPESHLHPKGQSKLAELMCLAAQNGVQIFCETHSDHIFYGTRVAIKEGKIEPEKVKTYYFDRSKTEYNSVVHFININKKGRIIGDMPDGFFDQYEINLDKLL